MSLASEELFAKILEYSMRREERRAMEHPSTCDLVIMSLTELGGRAHISEIYEVFANLRRIKRPNLPYKRAEDLQDLVRSCLRNHSRDCIKDVRDDYFHNPEKGLGYWMLNPGVRYDEENMRVVVK